MLWKKNLSDKVKKYLPDVITYSPKHIRFLLNLYNFAMKYPRIIYVRTSLRFIKGNFKCIREKIENDMDYDWTATL